MKPTTEQLKDLLAKVTPGEWAVKTGVYVDKDSCIVFANDGDIDRHIADCGVPKTNENESNAKLIKLAPSLAREVIAWRKLIADADDLIPRMSDDDPIAPALWGWLNRARAISQMNGGAA